jgi:hypothetical protein
MSLDSLVKVRKGGKRSVLGALLWKILRQGVGKTTNSGFQQATNIMGRF